MNINSSSIKITLSIKLCSLILIAVILFLNGCGNNNPDSAQHLEEAKNGKVNFAQLVEETERLLSGEIQKEKPREAQQTTTVIESTSSPVNEAADESSLINHELNFFFPNRFEEDSYLEILEKDICDQKAVARRRKESTGLTSCATWKARLKKAKTMLKLNISKYESGGKAWEAVNTMKSGFIAGDVILTGDEEWPDTPEGQIEARSFIKSYYGRGRPIYVSRNQQRNPKDYLGENDKELEALRAGK